MGNGMTESGMMYGAVYRDLCSINNGLKEILELFLDF